MQAPQPAAAWDDVLPAVVSPPCCTQKDPAIIASSEDCLYLNVYTPIVRETISLPTNKTNSILIPGYDQTFIIANIVL